VLGHATFSLLGSRLPIFWRAAAATVATLLITTMFLIGIVAASNMDPAAFLHEHAGLHDGGGEVHHDAGPATGHLSVRRFALMALLLGALGWLIEAAITGAVVKFIAQVKPDLLRHILHTVGAGKEPSRR
jgi:ABC-type Co2+ transport system permease subunit